MKVAADSMAVRPVRRSEETSGGQRSRAWPAGRRGARKRPRGGRGGEHGRSAGAALGRDPVEVAAAALGGAQKRKLGAGQRRARRRTCGDSGHRQLWRSAEAKERVAASAVVGGEPLEVAVVAGRGGAHGAATNRWEWDLAGRTAAPGSARIRRLPTGDGIEDWGHQRVWNSG